MFERHFKGELMYIKIINMFFKNNIWNLKKIVQGTQNGIEVK